MKNTLQRDVNKGGTIFEPTKAVPDEQVFQFINQSFPFIRPIDKLSSKFT